MLAQSQKQTTLEHQARIEAEQKADLAEQNANLAEQRAKDLEQEPARRIDAEAEIVRLKAAIAEMIDERKPI